MKRSAGLMPPTQFVMTPQAILPAHETLKAATADLHRAVEKGFSPLDLARPADYRQFLAAHALVIPPVEEALEDAGIAALLRDWPTRTRRDALRKDLAILGLEMPKAGPGPDLPTAASMLGAAYVLEGSRLGAQVITRMIGQNSDPKVMEATHFLKHGTGARLWPSFLAILNENVTGQAAIGEAQNSARRVFSLFLRTQRAAQGETAFATGT